MAPDDECAAPVGFGGGLFLQEAGLADPGFSLDQDEPRAWGRHSVDVAVGGGRRGPRRFAHRRAPGVARRRAQPSRGGAGPSPPHNADTAGSGTQFRLFEQTVALVGRVSAGRPVVLFVDDLQWADAASLDPFSHLTARLPGGTAVIGALRDRLTRVLEFDSERH